MNENLSIRATTNEGADRVRSATLARTRRRRVFLGEEIPAARRLPRITRCYESRPQKPSLDSRLAIQIVLVAAGLVALGCAHLWLQFAITDVRVQYQKVQQTHRELLQRATLLEHENERLCDVARLREYAVQKLKMVETDPSQRALASLPPEFLRKYQDQPATSRDSLLAHLGAPDTPTRATIEKLLLTVTDVNKAFAGED